MGWESTEWQWALQQRGPASPQQTDGARNLHNSSQLHISLWLMNRIGISHALQQRQTSCPHFLAKEGMLASSSRLSRCNVAQSYLVLGVWCRHGKYFSVAPGSSWLSCVYLSPCAVVAVLVTPTGCTSLLQCVLVRGRAACLCWEWTQEKLKVWIFWDSLAGGRFKTPNLLQSVMPGSYQHCCIKAALHVHSNTFFFSWAVTWQTRS